jgi:hypothetical protein
MFKVEDISEEATKNILDRLLPPCWLLAWCISHPEDRGNILVHNACKFLPDDTVSPGYSRRCQNLKSNAGA